MRTEEELRLVRALRAAADALLRAGLNEEAAEARGVLGEPKPAWALSIVSNPAVPADEILFVQRHDDRRPPTVTRFKVIGDGF